MSRDLWAEFGGGLDPETNPWAESTPTLPLSSHHPHGRPYDWSRANNTDQLERAERFVKEIRPTATTNDTRVKDEGWGPFEKEPSLAPVQGQFHQRQDVPVPEGQVLWELLEEGQDAFGDFESPEEANDSEVIASSTTTKISDSVSIATRLLNQSTDLKKSTIQSPKLLESRLEEPWKDLEQIAVADPGNSRLPGPLKKDRNVLRKKQAGYQPIVEITREEVKRVDDDWDNFDDWSPEVAHEDSAKAHPTKSSIPRDSLTETRLRIGAAAIPAANSEASNLPPANIPPPSLLLSYCCSSVQSAVKDSTMTTQEILLTVRTSARLIAGRRSRWKRDSHLAQSMSIGQAGRQSGMKLAGVDRAEVEREDREVAELVWIWRQNAGLIRQVVSKGAGQDEKVALPAIAEVIPVRTLKDTDGAVRAAKCCALCGLRREERVEKLDIDVFDNFGEFWVEHWGHKECKAFWTQAESRLRQQ